MPLSHDGLGTDAEWSSPKAVIVSGVSALVFLATTVYVTVLPECTSRASPEVAWSAPFTFLSRLIAGCNTVTNVPSLAVTTPLGSPARPSGSLAVMEATLWTASVTLAVYEHVMVSPVWSTAPMPLSHDGLGTDAEGSSPKAVTVSGVSGLVFLATIEYVTVSPGWTWRASPEVAWSPAFTFLSRLIAGWIRGRWWSSVSHTLRFSGSLPQAVTSLTMSPAPTGTLKSLVSVVD